MNITIDPALVPTLERLAAARSLTPEQYVSEFVAIQLLAQYKNHVVSKVASQKLPELVMMETAVMAVEATLVERDK